MRRGRPTARREWLAEQAARAVDEHAATDAEQDVLWGQGSCPDRVPADLLTDDERTSTPTGTPGRVLVGMRGKGGGTTALRGGVGVPGGLLGSRRRGADQGRGRRAGPAPARRGC